MELKPYLRKTHFYETDAMGIIYHANYVHFMEEARCDFMEQLGWRYEKVTEAGYDIALTGIGCQYKSMTRFGDTLSIRMSITGLSPAKLEIGYRMEDAATGALRCLASSGHFYYDRAKGRPVALKKYLPELYALFERLVEKEPEWKREA